MSNNSIVEHRANYHFVSLREEFLILCQNCKYKKPDAPKSKNKASIHCKALILDILEHWTNTKRDKGASLAVYMTYKQWAEYMYGMYGRNVIIDSLDELIGEGLIAREPYKMFGKDTFQYFLNYRELNNRIKSLPEKTPEQIQPQIEKDPFTNKPVEPDTRLLVNATDLQVNPTRLLVNEDPFTSNHNVDTTKITNRDSSQNTERDSASTNNSQNSTTELTFPTSQKSSFKQKEILLTPQGKRITDLYQGHKKRKMVFNEIDMVAANKLGQALEQDADFLDILKEIDQDDFINKRGVRVDLDYIWRKLNGFLDVIHRKRNGKSHSTSNSTAPSQLQERPSVLVSNEARERNLAKLRASVAQAK